MPDIVLIGAGRVATHLAAALVREGLSPVAVCSRTLASARRLVARLGDAVEALDDISRLPRADLYIYAVKDDALPAMADAVGRRFPDALHIHTSGSTALDVFPQVCTCCGVMYPMQTFSADRPVDMRRVPLFIEGRNAQSIERVTNLAHRLSDHVQPLDSTRRRALHLAAVFACNFVNHCYALAAQVVEQQAGVTWQTLLPLVDETAAKVHQLHPIQAQTGPAVRMDRRIIGIHEAMLAAEPDVADIYHMMSRSIHRMAQRDDPESTVCQEKEAPQP